MAGSYSLLGYDPRLHTIGQKPLWHNPSASIIPLTLKEHGANQGPWAHMI